MRTCSQMVLGYSRDNIAANRKLHSIMIFIVNFKDFWHIIESVNYVAATQKKKWISELHILYPAICRYHRR